jgi:hypothetical protein
MLLNRMLGLSTKKHPAKLVPSELDRPEREIASTDAEIEELVYDLPARRGGPAAGRAVRHQPWNFVR